VDAVVGLCITVVSDLRRRPSLITVMDWVSLWGRLHSS